MCCGVSHCNGTQQLTKTEVESGEGGGGNLKIPVGGGVFVPIKE